MQVVISKEVKEYLFDLRNIAAENGFKSEKPWQVKLASQADKNSIEKQYHASVSVKAGAEKLASMLAQVEAELMLPATASLSLKDIRLNELQYLVAYNPLQERR
ncbi:hypothetical protein ACEN9X_28200 [Mucilaginibacter sp. Mucisp86]|uniref:hypothetical protein n=1 Tax=Mucilaginibacter sp. Mucisp86 TaxID=3243060 RepID=UPI0039B3FFC2